MWRSIDIGYHGGVHWNVEHKLPELYRLAVDLSFGGLLDVNMEYFASEGLLCYITDRSKHLRRLRLVGCGRISDVELVEMAGNLQLLEELELSYCHFSSEVVAAFGRQCPWLKSFKLNARGCRRPSVASDDEAFTIAKNMSGLQHLQIFGNRLMNVGLIAILDGCQQLESLDLRQCFHVNLDADLKRRCTEGIKHFRSPNDSTDDYPFDSQVDDSYMSDDDV